MSLYTLLTKATLRRLLEPKQYASQAYRDALAAHGIECSMSRKGDCWDNAVAESFFGTLKTELVYRTRWTTRLEARTAVFE